MTRPRKTSPSTPIVRGQESSHREVPSGGFCESVFLRVTSRNRPDQASLGGPDQSADYGRLAGYHAMGVSGRECRLPAPTPPCAESPERVAERIIHAQLAGVRPLSFPLQTVWEVYP